MHIQAITGQVQLQGQWYNVIEASLIRAGERNPDDRFFLAEPIKMPGTNYSRKSFKRSEIQGYKA